MIPLVYPPSHTFDRVPVSRLGLRTMPFSSLDRLGLVNESYQSLYVLDDAIRHTATTHITKGHTLGRLYSVRARLEARWIRRLNSQHGVQAATQYRLGAVER